MQTFLPYRSFKKSAQSLDRQRLGKQRIEAKQIYFALTIPDYGWKQHPIVKMWKGYEKALLEYSIEICKEWRKRGYNDAQLEFFEKEYAKRKEPVRYPEWLGKRKFHLSHKSNLVRKLPEHYSPLFEGVDGSLPYEWYTEE